MEEVRKTTRKDGTVMFIWENKLHSWEGPAQINPDGSKEYFLHGIPMSEKEWKARIKGQEGLPYYKRSGFKQRI